MIGTDPLRMRPKTAVQPAAATTKESLKREHDRIKKNLLDDLKKSKRPATSTLASLSPAMRMRAALLAANEPDEWGPIFNRALDIAHTHPDDLKAMHAGIGQFAIRNYKKDRQAILQPEKAEDEPSHREAELFTHPCFTRFQLFRDELTKFIEQNSAYYNIVTCITHEYELVVNHLKWWSSMEARESTLRQALYKLSSEFRQLQTAHEAQRVKLVKAEARTSDLQHKLALLQQDKYEVELQLSAMVEKIHEFSTELWDSEPLLLLNKGELRKYTAQTISSQQQPNTIPKHPDLISINSKNNSHSVTVNQQRLSNSSHTVLLQKDTSIATPTSTTSQSNGPSESDKIRKTEENPVSPISTNSAATGMPSNNNGSPLSLVHGEFSDSYNQSDAKQEDIIDNDNDEVITSLSNIVLMEEEEYNNEESKSSSRLPILPNGNNVTTTPTEDEGNDHMYSYKQHHRGNNKGLPAEPQMFPPTADMASLVLAVHKEETDELLSGDDKKKTQPPTVNNAHNGVHLILEFIKKLKTEIYNLRTLNQQLTELGHNKQQHINECVKEITSQNDHITRLQDRNAELDHSFGRLKAAWLLMQDDINNVEQVQQQYRESNNRNKHLTAEIEELNDRLQHTVILIHRFLSKRGYANDITMYMGDPKRIKQVEDKTKRNVFYVPLGTGPEVPLPLRSSTKVKNRQPDKKELDLLLLDIWRDKSVTDEKDKGKRKSEFVAHMQKYLRTKYGDNQTTEYMYSFMDTILQYESLECDYRMLGRLLANNLPDQLYQDVNKQVGELRKALRRREKSLPKTKLANGRIPDSHYLPVHVIWDTVRDTFPNKGYDNLYKLNFTCFFSTQDEEYGSDGVVWINVQSLLEPHSYFIDEFKVQCVQEFDDIVSHVYRALLETSKSYSSEDMVTLKQAEQVLLQLDPRFAKEQLRGVVLGAADTLADLRNIAANYNNIKMDREVQIGTFKGGLASRCYVKRVSGPAPPNKGFLAF